MPETFFGKSIKRREDQRLITGKGNFVDDVKIPFTTHAAFVRSPHAHARINKIDARTAHAIEPRACLASANPGTGETTLWVTSQNPHVHRLIMAAFVLGIPEHKLRVISPDVGGGFGSKIFIYPEECVVTWASRALSRPIKWTCDRREAFLTDAHGRDHHTEAEMALSADGKILAMRVKTIANLGAYLSLFAPSVPTYLYGTLLAGPYTTPAIHVEVTGVFTHTTPVDAYPGAGRPEATYVIERLVDLSAKALSMDPL